MFRFCVANILAANTTCRPSRLCICVYSASGAQKADESGQQMEIQRQNVGMKENSEESEEMMRDTEDDDDDDDSTLDMDASDSDTQVQVDRVRVISTCSVSKKNLPEFL